MQVSEIMHKGVTTIQITESLRRAASIMKKEDIGSLPVYKNNRPVGFVTDRDIVVTCVANGKTPDESVSLAMTRNIISIREFQDISEAAKIMKENQVSRLLVVDAGQEPVGMLTLREIGLNNDDEHIKADVITEIKRS